MRVRIPPPAPMNSSSLLLDTLGPQVALHLRFPNYTAKCDECRLRFKCFTDDKRIDLFASIFETSESLYDRKRKFRAVFESFDKLDLELIGQHLDELLLRTDDLHCIVEAYIVKTLPNKFELEVQGELRYDFDGLYGRRSQETALG